MTWLSGALVATHYKWGFFAFGTIAYCLLAISLLWTGSITARRIGIQKSYTALSGWLVFVWLLYPIAYGVDDGGNKIGVTEGFIFFGILDVVTVPVLAIATLFLSLKWDYRSLNLYFTQYGRVPLTGEFPERKTEKATTAADEATAPGVVAPEQAV